MTALTEARGVKITKGADPTRFQLQIITPGLGTSGYYSAEVLEAAVTDVVFPAGTHLYADHPTRANAGEPRSVRDLAGVTEADAVWNAATQAIEAPCKVYPHYAWLSEVAPDIGMSIRADGEVSQGQIGGQQVQVIDKLTEGRSVDFVSKAGRGGKIIAAMEAARDDVDLGEASANDTREALSNALRETYGSEKGYVWVRDFDPDTATVTFAIMGEDDSESLWQQGYAQGDSGVSLDGDRREVRAVTNYVPITTTTQEGEVAQISEAEHQAVRDQLAEAQRTIETRDQEVAALRAAERGREVREAAQTFVTDTIGTQLDQRPAAFKQRVIESAMLQVPLAGDQLDQTAMRARIDSAIKVEEAYYTAVNGGTVTGHGSTTSTASVQEAEKAREASDKARQGIGFN